MNPLDDPGLDVIRRLWRELQQVQQGSKPTSPAAQALITQIRAAVEPRRRCVNDEWLIVAKEMACGRLDRSPVRDAERRSA